MKFLAYESRQTPEYEIFSRTKISAITVYKSGDCSPRLFSWLCRGAKRCGRGHTTTDCRLWWRAPFGDQRRVLQPHTPRVACSPTSRRSWQRRPCVPRTSIRPRRCSRPCSSGTQSFAPMDGSAAGGGNARFSIQSFMESASVSSCEVSLTADRRVVIIVRVRLDLKKKRKEKNSMSTSSPFFLWLSHAPDLLLSTQCWKSTSSLVVYGETAVASYRTVQPIIIQRVFDFVPWNHYW